MEHSIEELKKMEFNDAFEIEEDEDEDEDKYDDLGFEDCCFICGEEIGNIKISYNAKNKLFKHECPNCGATTVYDEDYSEGVTLKGEKRDWPEYLQEALKFPFEAMIIEASDREFFDPDYDGPRHYDTVNVLDIRYSYKYGVEALIKLGRRAFSQVLCFLEATDIGSRNYVEVEHYKRWRDKYWSSDYLTAFLDALGRAKKADGAK